MFPIATMNDSPNRMTTNSKNLPIFTKFISDVCLNPPSIFFFNFAFIGRLSSAWWIIPSLIPAIAHIFFLCPEAKMIRSHARRIITAVHDDHSCRYFSTMNFPRYAMSWIRIVRQTFSRQSSIGRLSHFRTSPYPAIRRFFNVFPKASFAAHYD